MLSYCMLFATLWPKVLWAASHHLSAQITVMPLAWPTTYVIIIPNLPINLTTSRARMFTITKKFSMNLPHHLSWIHLCLPKSDFFFFFFRKKFTNSITITIMVSVSSIPKENEYRIWSQNDKNEWRGGICLIGRME